MLAGATSETTTSTLSLNLISLKYIQKHISDKSAYMNNLKYRTFTNSNKIYLKLKLFTESQLFEQSNFFVTNFDNTEWQLIDINFNALYFGIKNSTKIDKTCICICDR